MSFRIAVTNKHDPIRNFNVQWLELQQAIAVQRDLKERYVEAEGWTVQAYEYYEGFHKVDLPK